MADPVISDAVLAADTEGFAAYVGRDGREQHRAGLAAAIAQHLREQHEPAGGGQPYRVGRKVGRTVYAATADGDELIGVMDTPELGAQVVAALNRDSAAVGAVLLWAADEIEAQATAHNDPVNVDLTDHIRCFADQPGRRSLVPWPAAVPRPATPASAGAPEAPLKDVPLCPACGIQHTPPLHYDAPMEGR